MLLEIKEHTGIIELLKLSKAAFFIGGLCGN
jgi:hypothetical protein